MPVHRAKIVQFGSSKIEDSLDWPAQRPDINPIEKLWMEFLAKEIDCPELFSSYKMLFKNGEACQ